MQREVMAAGTWQLAVLHVQSGSKAREMNAWAQLFIQSRTPAHCAIHIRTGLLSSDHWKHPQRQIQIHGKPKPSQVGGHNVRFTPGLALSLAVAHHLLQEF